MVSKSSLGVIGRKNIRVIKMDSLTELGSEITRSVSRITFSMCEDMDNINEVFSESESDTSNLSNKDFQDLRM